MAEIQTVDEQTQALLDRSGSTPLVSALAIMMFVASENADRQFREMGNLLPTPEFPAPPLMTSVREVVEHFRGHGVGLSAGLMDKFRAAAEFASQHAVGFWLPIALAPDDGRRVLVGRKGFYPQMASWPKHIANASWPTLASQTEGRFAKPTHFAFVNEPEGSE